MCQNVEFSPPVWNEAGGRKHRRTGIRCKKLWDRSLLVAVTAQPNEPAVYDPNLTMHEIREMEMDCVLRGMGMALPQRVPHVRRFYRVFDRAIGASNGEKTECILVQYNSDGAVHGYPVTREYLRKRGASDV